MKDITCKYWLLDQNEPCERAGQILVILPGKEFRAVRKYKRTGYSPGTGPNEKSDPKGGATYNLCKEHYFKFKSSNNVVYFI